MDKTEKLRSIIRKYVREEIAHIFGGMAHEINEGGSHRRPVRENRNTLDDLYESEMAGDSGARSNAKRSQRLLRESMNNPQRRAPAPSRPASTNRGLGEISPLGAALAIFESKMQRTTPEKIIGTKVSPDELIRIAESTKAYEGEGDDYDDDYEGEEHDEEYTDEDGSNVDEGEEDY